MNENKDEETLPLEEQPLTLFDEPTTNDNLVLFDDFEVSTPYLTEVTVV